MTRVLVVAEMIIRDLACRRAVLLLLASVPLVFDLARHDQVGKSVRFASLGVAWAVSTLALFSSTAGKQAEPRLVVRCELATGTRAGTGRPGMNVARTRASTSAPVRTMEALTKYSFTQRLVLL